MVQPGYLLKKPPPPSAMRIFLDQRITPSLINAAGGVEMLVQRIARTTRESPAQALTLSLVVGFLLGSLCGRRDRRTE